MVFLSLNLLTRCRGPDEFWRKRKIFKLAADSSVFDNLVFLKTESLNLLFEEFCPYLVLHFIGRRRNCYSIAIKSVHRALVYCSEGRKQKKKDMKELREQRIVAGIQEHGINFRTFREGLTRCNILLNRKSLADLAIWEPRSFKSLTDIACARAKQDHLRSASNIEVPKNVVVKGLIK